MPEYSYHIYEVLAIQCQC